MPCTRLSPETFALPLERLRDGYYSDAYFNCTKRVLEAQDLHPRVTMQVFQKQEGALLGGVDEALAVLKLCAGHFAGDAASRTWEPGWDQLRVSALYDGDEVAPWDAVMTIEGDYSLFAHLETVLLGALTRRTLISTNVRRVVDAADCVGTSLACARALGDRLWGSVSIPRRRSWIARCGRRWGAFGPREWLRSWSTRYGERWMSKASSASGSW